MSGEQSGKDLDSSCNSSSSSRTSGDSTAVAAVRPFVINAEPVRKPVTIHEAASNGDVDSMKEFLDEGVRIDIRDSHGNSPLHCAVQHNREEVVKLLLEKGAKVSLKGHLRNTPLHTASFFGRENILNCLIESGTNPNTINIKEQTPLILACMKGNLECVKMLLESGADLHKVDRCGLTPLMYAAQQSGMSQSVSEGETTFDSALEDNYLKIAEQLIEKGAKVNSADNKKQTALHFAAAKGSLKMINTLHKAGADHSTHDNKYRTPLDVAGLNGHEQAVYEMLEFLPEGTVPLSSMEKAAADGNMNYMKVLFEAFGRKAFRTSDAIYKASLRGHVECVQFLIKAGFDVNKYWCNGNSFQNPVQAAAQEGKLDCLRELLKAGADVNARYGDNYYTALHLAAKNGHKSCVEELLKCGAKHLRVGNKYPWVVAKNEEIKQLLTNHLNQQQ